MSATKRAWPGGDAAARIWPPPVNGRLVVTYNEVGIAAAVAGLGLVSMTIGAAKRELAEGALVRVLADWDMGEIELHAVFPAGRAAKPAARAFVDFLIAEFAND
jgi:DNA-binding transcriptional LysR family regulator